MEVQQTLSSGLLGTLLRGLPALAAVVNQRLSETNWKNTLRCPLPCRRGDRYRLFEHNCNTFTNEVAQFLTGRTIPSYITDLPSEVLST